MNSRFAEFKGASFDQQNVLMKKDILCPFRYILFNVNKLAF